VGAGFGVDELGAVGSDVQQPVPVWSKAPVAAMVRPASKSGRASAERSPGSADDDVVPCDARSGITCWAVSVSRVIATGSLPGKATMRVFGGSLGSAGPSRSEGLAVGPVVAAVAV